MAEGAGFEPAWAFALTVFKTFPSFGLSWKLTENMPSVWKLQRPGKVAGFKGIMPTNPHGYKANSNSRRKAEKRLQKRENGENLGRKERSQERTSALATPMKTGSPKRKRRELMHRLLLLANKKQRCITWVQKVATANSYGNFPTICPRIRCIEHAILVKRRVCSYWKMALCRALTAARKHGGSKSKLAR